MIDGLQKLTPAITKKRRLSWLYAVLITGLALGTAFLIISKSEGGNAALSSVPIVLGIFGISFLNKWVMRSQQRLILPLLAKSVDLHCQHNAKPFLNEMPTRLLPEEFLRTAVNCISGTIGGRRMKFAEAWVAPSPDAEDESDGAFKGLLLRMDNKAPLPAFFIAQETLTKGKSSRLNVKGLVEAGTKIGKSGKRYTIWLSKEGRANTDPTLSAVLDILVKIDAQIGPKATLYSATSTGRELHIAFSHDPDLFRIGGLFTSQSRITDGLEKALEDMNIPLRIVSKVLEAEQEASQTKQA